jgi:uncharacterized protein YcfL
MKTIKTLIILSTILVVGCTQKESKTINEVSKNRIKLKESRIIEGYRYSIIEVDSIEYLASERGGIIRITEKN